nr:glycosyltransferase [Sulfobacillus harzensis]
MTVVMATYNGARYLPEQLDSLVRQTRLPDQVVVSDDHSTDATWEVLEAFAHRAPFAVRLVRNTGDKGYVHNFLNGLKEADGDIIFLSDQDDVWLKDKLSTVQAAMEDAHASLAVHAARVVDQDLNPLGRLLPRIPRSATAPAGDLGDGPLKSFPLGFCLAFRRTAAVWALPRLQDYPETFRFYFGHEIPLYWASKALGPTVYLAQPLALYRRHGMNASRGMEPPSATQALIQGADDYAQFAHHQQIRADFAAWLRQQNAPNPHERIDAFLESMERISKARSESMEYRAALYREPNRLRRLQGVLRLAWQGGYGSRSRGALGLKSLAKDVASLMNSPRRP